MSMGHGSEDEDQAKEKEIDLVSDDCNQISTKHETVHAENYGRSTGVV